jgi:multimeric flavodoxin WrbA
MKIAAFLGSPRKNGNTARLLKEFLKGVSQKSETTINEVFLQENRIAACLSCDYCERLTGCIQNDDMQKIYPVIKDADVLVFAMPVY